MYFRIIFIILPLYVFYHNRCLCFGCVGTDEDRHTLNIIKIIQGVQNPASNVQASITFFRACERNSKCACKNTSYLDFVT
jgi:hypothetical protein